MVATTFLMWKNAASSLGLEDLPLEVEFSKYYNLFGRFQRISLVIPLLPIVAQKSSSTKFTTKEQVASSLSSCNRVQILVISIITKINVSNGQPPYVP